MILRILFLTFALCASPSLGKMDMAKFGRNFEDMCFQNEATDPFRVNGQDTPLSNTLENFISMAERFEAANPSFDLKDELTYFLSEYVFENIKFINGRVDVWTVGRANFDKIEAMWDPDVNGYKPTYNDPFSDAEKCSIFYMISHSILRKDADLIQSRSYSPGNFSARSEYLKPVRTQELVPDEYFPQEMGVVAIRGTDAAVSISKVLMGLFVGLKPDRKTELTSYESVQNLQIPPDQLPQDTIVDALFAVTMADVVMRAKWTGSDRPGLAPNGRWVSIPINDEKKIDGFCPMVYMQQIQNGNLPAYSYSSVRGAADGLILGLAARDVYQKKSNAKLSQILRMYYSPDGISLDSPIEEMNSKHVSFCNRQSLVEVLDHKLRDQMKSYSFLIAQNLKDVDQGLQKALSLYDSEKNTIFQNSNSELRDYCDRPTSLEKPEDLPRETYLDIIVVMDSSNSENSFQEQQMIAGYLAKYLDLRHTGSRMTILLDQKISSGTGSSSKIELKPVVLDADSSSCAACAVGQIGFEPSTVERDEIIVGVDQYLQERKENETKLYGVNGKVVVYFNYENDDGRSSNGRGNKIQGRMEKALRDFHLRHQDVVFYAVGLDSELLKKYAKNDPSLVFLGTDGTSEDVAKRIFQKISFAPALLQYSDCTDEKAEKVVSYESLVSPHSVLHYEMPAEYFYKSLKLAFKFESQNSNIRVCHSRATVKPENEIKNCKNTTGNTFAEFKMSNPCKGFSKETCAPFYFSVIGMNANEGEMRVDTRSRPFCNDLNDKWCATLDQVKFKVSHTGVRCSGCFGLGASTAVILLTLLLTYVLHKQF